MTQSKGTALAVTADALMATPEFQKTVLANLPINEMEFRKSLFLTIKSNSKFENGSIPIKKIMEGVIRAGRDGLICDGREAALVPYGQELQYIQMVSGLIKMAFNSGKITSINSEVVYDNDEFDYQQGDKAFINYKKLLRGNRGERYAAFAIIELKGGGVIRRIMTKDEIERIRIEFSAAGGDAKSGPKGIWLKHPDAQWEKTVLRTALKKAPLSSEEQALLQSGDDDIKLDPIDPNPPTPPVTPTAPPETSKTNAAEKLKNKAEGKTGTPPPAGDSDVVDAEVVVEGEEDLEFI